MRHLFIPAALATMLLFLPPQLMAEPISPETAVAELKGVVITYADLTRGQEITPAQAGGRLSGRVMSVLIDEFGRENNLAPTDEEIKEFVLGSERAKQKMMLEDEARILELRAKLQDPSVPEAQKKKDRELLALIESNRAAMHEDDGALSKEDLKRVEEQVARQFVLRWKINRALFARYGGRVIFQQAGPEPLDAYLRFLREHQGRGSFKVHSEELKEGFWRYYVNERMHTFYSDEEGEGFIMTPWWLMK